MTVRCDHCYQFVPMAPHFKHVSVPHARSEMTIDGERYVVPCRGNTARQGRSAPIWLAETLALQHLILEHDRYWEGL